MDALSAELYECACSAIFRCREGLKKHLADVQIEKNYHTTQLEKCFDHSRRDNEGHRCDGSCANLCLTCPHEACEAKSTTYKTKQKLIRHYAIHVKCYEVCIFCCIRFEESQKFLRHIEDCHNKERGRKADFMNTTCTELVTNVSQELLVAWHSKSSANTNLNGKRMRALSDVASVLDPERATKVRVTNDGHHAAQAATQSKFLGESDLTFT
ncbi:uncharacterized protein EKO05_0007467 [Ascochyta rabiei]|uniref:uncharacterized protein n=1 Tax=Didymella rabiei TaxID=5454 RepID=UPI00220ED4AD|nr:uncharacterized protein EKO05_0007467 [Ascochyta rabiei]UPX17091.1 hypothetical protein EKO05_0007467 [Ascochyta rabiei]